MRKSYSFFIKLSFFILPIFLITSALLAQKKFSISGNILDKSGAGINEVTVFLAGNRIDQVKTDATGFFKFENLDSGKTYKISPSKRGYTFEPSSKTFERIKENITQNFTGIAKPYYSISGYIKTTAGMPVKGIIVNVFSSNPVMSYLWKGITDSTGFYKVDNLEGDKGYIVKPDKLGYTFDPQYITIENLIENASLNFTIVTLPYYSISGVVKTSAGLPLPNAAVVLSGERVNKVLSDSTTGAYKFENLSAGKTYILSVNKTEYLFEPKVKVIEKLDGNKTQDFTGTPIQKYTISGIISDKNAKPVGGVIVNLIGYSNAVDYVKSYKVKTDSITGAYKFENIESGYYALTPINPKYVFEPKTKIFDSLTENKTQNFVASEFPKYSISGTITDKDKKPGGNVVLNLSGGKGMKTVSDSISGKYKFENIEPGKYYTVTPSKRGFVFEPKMRVIENLNKDENNLDFTATQVNTLSISGYVKDKNGTALTDITITLTGEKLGKVITDSKGFYKLENLEAGRYYAIIPSGKGYTFEPRVITFEPLTENKTQDFIASPVPIYSIEGYVKDSGNLAIPGVVVKLGGVLSGKTETDSSGYYKFDKVESGRFYLLLPSKRGYMFEPRYKVIENLNNNISQDFKGSKQSIGRFFKSNASDQYGNFSINFSVMGFVNDINSSFMNNVSIVLNGVEQIKTQTDENGFYVFDNLEEGRDYSITPVRSGYVFDPPSVSFDELEEDQAQFLLCSQLPKTVTDVKDKAYSIPKEVNLYQNYPNPFNPSTSIRFEIPKAGKVKLQVYDLIGRLVATLFDGNKDAGVYNVNLDGKSLGSGNYFVRLETNNIVKTMKILLVK